ncbi:hypothetical protein PISMIDRAFT_680401, partial [Pisolithus microcarpus 441]
MQECAIQRDRRPFDAFCYSDIVNIGVFSEPGLLTNVAASPLPSFHTHTTPLFPIPLFTASLTPIRYWQYSLALAHSLSTSCNANL